MLYLNLTIILLPYITHYVVFVVIYNRCVHMHNDISEGQNYEGR